MKRYCIILELKEEFIDKYCEMYKNPWPELLNALKENGVKEELVWNYKNLSIVYYECEDIGVLYEKLNKLDVVKKWHNTVGPWYKESLPVDSEGKFITCEKIFDLNQQLEGKLDQY